MFEGRILMSFLEASEDLPQVDDEFQVLLFESDSEIHPKRNESID